MSRNLITVAISIVLLIMLLGLLLTAVQQTRAAVARSKCQSNLCQIATSLHYYAETDSNRMPTAALLHDNLPPEQRLSWCIWFLIICDRNSFERLNLKAGAADGSNRDAIDRRIEYFNCPSSGESQVGYDGVQTWKSPHPVTHYVGIAGIGADAPLLPLRHPRAGAFGYERQTSFDKGFVDGTSNTIMLMETSLNPGHWAFGGPSTVRGVEPNGHYIGPGKQFGGHHSYRNAIFEEKRIVAQIAMVDGSVKQIRSTIAREVFEALATVEGKEPIPADW